MLARLSKVAADAIDALLTINLKCDLYELAALYSTTYKIVCVRRKNLRLRIFTSTNFRQEERRLSFITRKINVTDRNLRRWFTYTSRDLARDPNVFNSKPKPPPLRTTYGPSAITRDP